MNRPRKHDRHLPRNVYHRHGAYWFVKGGKWTRMGTTLREALTRYAGLYDAPKGSMPELITRALPSICAKVKASTARQYQTAARRLAKKLGEFQPHELTHADINQVMRELAATPNMANRCLSVLRLVLQFALDERLITMNPAIGIKRHVEKKRDRLPSIEEIAAIYAHAGPRLQVVIDLLARTGQRIVDVLSIRRTDLTDEGIAFYQQKTGAKVLVPWTPELREVVARARGLYGNIIALTLLHNRRGKRPDYRTVRDQWERACLAAGVVDAHLHDMRAVAATWGKRQGLNPTALLGHAHPSQTVRYLRDRETVVAAGPSFGQLLDKGSK